MRPAPPVLPALFLIAAVAVSAAFVAAPQASATAAAPAIDADCAEARRTDGWCDARGVGYVAFVEIPSRLLYDTLDAHGHVLDLTTFTCPSCRRAIDTEGFCEEHRVGFVRRPTTREPLAYFSRLTYEMARGARVEPASFRCAECRRHAEAGFGWCAKHRTGLIGSAAIRDRAAWDRAAAAVEVLRASVAMLPKCEHCAVAMVTDTECWDHKITYKDGKPLPRPGS